MLRTLGKRPKHFTTYHNFFKRCECPLLKLSRILCSLIFALVSGVIELAVDETICRQVFGSSCHRDPLLSTHKRAQYSFGHKWVVLAVRFHWPWLKRPWSLPCLMALWVSEKNCPKYKLKHPPPLS